MLDLLQINSRCGQCVSLKLIASSLEESLSPLSLFVTSFLSLQGLPGPPGPPGTDVSIKKKIIIISPLNLKPGSVFFFSPQDGTFKRPRLESPLSRHQFSLWNGYCTPSVWSRASNFLTTKKKKSPQSHSETEASLLPCLFFTFKQSMARSGACYVWRLRNVTLHCTAIL